MLMIRRRLNSWTAAPLGQPFPREQLTIVAPRDDELSVVAAARWTTLAAAANEEWFEWYEDSHLLLGANIDRPLAEAALYHYRRRYRPQWRTHVGRDYTPGGNDTIVLCPPEGAKPLSTWELRRLDAQACLESRTIIVCSRATARAVQETTG